MMSLQKIIFCSQIERILVDKQVCLSEYDTFLMRAFENLERCVYVPDAKTYDAQFITNYKNNFVRTYRDFYLIYKKIILQWEIYAFDIGTIMFSDIPCVKNILETFDNYYYVLMKKKQ